MRARWPFKRGSRPPSAAAAPGLSQATATTATYPAASGGPPLRASQWLQPTPSQVLIGRRGSRSERQEGRGPTPPREERAASRRREGRTWRRRCRRGRGAALPACSVRLWPAGHAGRCSPPEELALPVPAGGAPGGAWPGVANRAAKKQRPGALRRRRGEGRPSLPHTLTSSLDSWSWASGQGQAWSRAAA